MDCQAATDGVAEGVATSAGFRQTGRFDENTLKGLALMPD